MNSILSTGNQRVGNQSTLQSSNADAPVMQIYKWGVLGGETYKPLPELGSRRFDYLCKKMFRAAKQSGTAVATHQVSFTMGRAVNLYTLTEDDTSDNMFAICYNDLAFKPVSVSLVLRPEMNPRQVELHLDWIEKLATNEFGFPSSPLTAEEPLLWRKDILEHRPCMVTAYNFLHRRVTFPYGHRDPDIAQTTFEECAIAQQIAYYLILRKPVVFLG